jgi:hypothetical protein
LASAELMSKAFFMAVCLGSGHSGTIYHDADSELAKWRFQRMCWTFDATVRPSCRGDRAIGFLAKSAADNLDSGEDSAAQWAQSGFVVSTCSPVRREHGPIPSAEVAEGF